MLTDACVSGIRAAATHLSVSAHNIANVNTDGFKAYRAVSREQPIGQGVRVFVEGTEHATDLAEEMVEQVLALRYAQANRRVFRAQNEALGRLVDMWA